MSNIYTRLADVLDSVNRVRSATGTGILTMLPKGRPSHGTSCPLANALPGNCNVASSIVGPDTALLTAVSKEYQLETGKETPVTYNGYGSYRVATPPSWRSFISAFDHGNIPELQD